MNLKEKLPSPTLSDKSNTLLSFCRFIICYCRHIWHIQCDINVPNCSDLKYVRLIWPEVKRPYHFNGLFPFWHKISQTLISFTCMIVESSVTAEELICGPQWWRWRSMDLRNEVNHRHNHGHNKDRQPISWHFGCVLLQSLYFKPCKWIWGKRSELGIPPNVIIPPQKQILFGQLSMIPIISYACCVDDIYLTWKTIRNILKSWWKHLLS